MVGVKALGIRLGLFITKALPAITVVHFQFTSLVPLQLRKIDDFARLHDANSMSFVDLNGEYQGCKLIDVHAMAAVKSLLLSTTNCY